MDNRTENVLIEDIQRAFHSEYTPGMSEDKSVIKGSSHSNQVSFLTPTYSFWLMGSLGENNHNPA